MILDTPTAERINPTREAMIPRIKKLPEAFERPILDPKIVKEKIARIGGNADAKCFFHDCTDEIEAIVRKRMGRENAITAKNPAAHSVGVEINTPMTDVYGNIATSRNHDRISIPRSLRKFRTLSPRRITAEFSASPRRLGMTTPISGKSRAA
jgi:hypothetical protein